VNFEINYIFIQYRFSNEAMKKTLLLSLLITISILPTLKAQEVDSSLKTDLINWLEKIPHGYEKQYGFENRNEFGLATIGKPIEVYTLSSLFFTDQAISDSNYFKSVGEWRVPILVNNSYRALLTAVIINTEWQIVDIGATTLARELEGFILMQSNNPSVEVKIIRIYQLKCDFIALDNPTKSSIQLLLYPMQSAFMNIPELSGIGNNGIDKKTLFLLLKDKNINNKTY
jgi:hypothetical protein